MSSEIKESNDSHPSKKIIKLLMQQDGVVVSPINLTVEMTKPLNIGQLKWINFYEPPLKLTLRNSGHTVTVQGRWPHQKPALSGGPLSGYYIFSQVHFHWDAVCHQHNRHTINGKSNSLEMHVLFYKNSYRNQMEAQEKEDGIIMVVYFFKVDKQSSIKWMTDYLRCVTAVKATKTLPPASLSSLMVPFSQDYLVYRGALPCDCHHVLWLVSRRTMRITVEEIQQFNAIQNNMRGEIHDRDIKTEKVTTNVYRINMSNDIRDVLFDDPLDPPSQITNKRSSIVTNIAYPPARSLPPAANPPAIERNSIVTNIAYPPARTIPPVVNPPTLENPPKIPNSSEIANPPMIGNSPALSNPVSIVDSPTTPKMIILNERDNNSCKLNSNLKTSSVDNMHNCLYKDKNTIMSNSDFKPESPDQCPCSKCNDRKTEIRDYPKTSAQKCIQVSQQDDQCPCSKCNDTHTEIRDYPKTSAQKCIQVSQQDALESEIATDNAVRSKSETRSKLLECSKRKIVLTKKVLEKKEKDIDAIKKVLNDEFEKFSLMQNSKETAEGNNSEVFNEENNNSLKQFKNIKSVLTSKPKTPCEKRKLNGEKEITETNTGTISACNQQGDSPASQGKPTGDQSTAKEGIGIKKVNRTHKSRSPVKISTPWRNKGLESSLTPYFRSSKNNQENKTSPDKQPETSIVNRTVNQQRQHLRGKGDTSYIPRRVSTGRK